MLARKILAAVGVIVLLAAIGLGLYGWLYDSHSMPVASAKPVNSAIPEATKIAKQPATIRLIATGDFIAHDSINEQAKQADGTYNYLPMMQDFVPIFQKADIRFCNDPILNGGAQFGIAGYPKFNSPTAFVTDMGELGCNLVNTASNHSFDRDQAAITASVNAWAGVPNMLAVAGENSSPSGHDSVRYFTVKGVKFAFLAYTTYINNDAPVQNNYGVNVFTQTFAAQQIAEAKSQGAQVIIASMRWGTEYSSTVTATQENDAQFLTDQGVALILGHGTHVLQPVAQLTGTGGNKTTVWYGLGNFINTQLPADTLFNGIAVMDFNIKTMQFGQFAWLPIYVHYSWTPAQAASQDNAALAARHDIHMYLLGDASQQMIDAQQLKTTIAAQKSRMQTVLAADGVHVPLITSDQLN